MKNYDEKMGKAIITIVLAIKHNPEFLTNRKLFFFEKNDQFSQFSNPTTF